VHPVALACADQGAQIRRTAHRVADPQGGGAAGEGVEVRSATARVTMWRLALMQVCPWNSSEAIIAHEAARSMSASSRTTKALLPPEFEPDRPQRGRGGRDGEADLTGAGEVQQVQAGVLGERVPRVEAVAGHHVEHTRRQSGGPGRLGEYLAADDRGELGGLEHDGVAEGQRRRHRPHGQVDRVVPGVITPITPSGTARDIESLPALYGGSRSPAFSLAWIMEICS
jgi:hypothetical protein